DEMREGLHLKSKSGIHRLINSLVERGFLERLPNRARALEVKRIPDNLPTPSSNISSTALLHADNFGVNDNMVEIPLLGKIAAGTAIEAVRNEIDTIQVPPHMLGSKACYALTVEGDSM